MEFSNESKPQTIVSRNQVAKVFIYLLCSFLFCRCTPSPPKMEEMIGTWQAKDGAIIQLNEDSSFVIKDFNSYFFFFYPKDSINAPLNAYGVWKIQKAPSLGHIYLALRIDFALRSRDSLCLSCEDKYVLKQYGQDIYIEDEIRIFSNDPKWVIRAIDVFDDYYTYDFYKVE